VGTAAHLADEASIGNLESKIWNPFSHAIGRTEGALNADGKESYIHETLSWSSDNDADYP
jgi:hypothetical protein